MAYKVVYFIKAYNIPTTLMICINQIGVHLVPIKGEKTWEMKGEKNIHVLRIEDKKQIIIAMLSSTNGNLLPLQIIFTRSTIKCLPPKTIGKISYLIIGFHIMYFTNH
jgi:hypothetical protein